MNKYKLLLLSLILISCQPSDRKEIVWNHFFQSLGTSSSPRCTDLNSDGTDDIIIGAGMNEFEVSDSAVLAIDGVSGEVLWAVAGTDQMVGSPVFMNINDDAIDDVVIGGRAAQLKAIDGKSGEIIWDFVIKHQEYNPKGLMRFNFYSPQVLHDLNGDGINEILISNGGNISAISKTGADRYPGVIGVLNGANGDIIAVDTMPDGNETYMSPIIFDINKDGDPEIIYGSGGETIGGHLYRTTLSKLLENDISNSQILVEREGHGFIAPPTLTDINKDGIYDIISNWHGGEIIAIDGNNNEILWEVRMNDTELNNSPTPGDVTADGIPDFFTSFSKGKWPKNTNTIQIIVDGSNGDVIYQDTMGCVGFSTALSYDFNNDGSEEFLWSLNDYHCSGIYLGMTKYQLLVLDYANDEIWVWHPTIRAKNIATTPWIGDLDKDGNIELIYCIQANFNDIFSYYGIQISRMDLNIPLSDGKGWTSYIGKDGNGVY